MVITLTAGCSLIKTENHLQIINNYGTPVHYIVGDKDYGIVEAYETTERKVFDNGMYIVSGDLNGSVSFDSIGVNYWTLTVTSEAYFLIEKK